MTGLKQCILILDDGRELIFDAKAMKEITYDHSYMGYGELKLIFIATQNPLRDYSDGEVVTPRLNQGTALLDDGNKEA